MTGFVYQWTHIDSGRCYIGSHGGSLDDGYIGSGLHFTRAFLKYGKEAFTRDILYQGSNYRAVEEAVLQHLDAASDPKYFNLSNVASGFDNDAVVECTVCGKIGKAAGMWRWHFEHCGRIDRITRTVESTCTVCGKTGDGPAFRFHHFENCGKLDRYQQATCTKCGKNDKAVTINRWHNERCGKSRYLGVQAECPHCGKIGQRQGMGKHHFDNCKKRCD